MEIKERDLFQVFIREDQKVHNKNPDINSVISTIKEEHNIPDITEDHRLEVKKSLKRYLTCKQRNFADKRLKIDWCELEKYGSDNIVIKFKPRPVHGTAARKSLTELNSRDQLKARTQIIWDNIVAAASKENVEPSQLLGFLLTRCPEKSSREIGQLLWKKTPMQPKLKLSVETALVPYTDCSLGRGTYPSQKRVLAAAGCDIFPAWRHLREKQQSITPPIFNLPPPHTGVYFNFIDAIRTTTSRILETMSLDDVEALQLSCKFGFDGSGGAALSLSPAEE